MFRCVECQPLLLDHLYGLLDLAETQAVQAHLGTCASCSAELDKVSRLKGLFAEAAKPATFPTVSFTPPAPVAQPSGKESVMSISPKPETPSIRGKVVGWSIAASLVLCIAAVGGPATWDTAGYAYYRPQVDAKLKDVRDVAEERDRIKLEVARKRAAASDRVKDALDKQQSLEKLWLQAEKQAIEKAAERPYNVELSGPGTAIPGAPNQYQIKIHDAQGKPHPAEVQASLKDADGKELFSAQFAPEKNPNGYNFQLPAGVWSKVNAGTEVFLAVSTTDAKTGARSDITESIRLYEPTFTTFLTTDKPMYRPGETVYFRSLTLDRSRFLPPSKDQHLRFEIKMPSGQILPGSQLAGLAKPGSYDSNGKFQPVLGPDGQPVRGIGCGAVPLDPSLAGGEYILNVYELPALGELKPASPGPIATRKFIVNQYTPDRLQKELEFDGKSYGPGDVVQAKFTLKDQATPLGGATIAVTIDVDGTIVKADVAPTKTEADGTAAIKFTLPKKEGMKAARLDVLATAKGIAETITKPVPLITRTLNIEFFPEGGDLVNGVANRVYFRATNTFGKPVDIVGVLTDGTKDITSIRTLTDAEKPGVNQGLGVLEFTPKAGTKYAVRLDKPLGIIQPEVELTAAAPMALAGAAAARTQRGYMLPDAKEKGIVLSVPGGVTKADAPITVKLISTDVKRTVLVGAYTRGRPIAHQTAILEAGKPTDITLSPTDTKFGGVTRITVFDAPNAETILRDDLKPLAERLVYRQPGELLKLNFTTKKASGDASKSFTPGSKVLLDIESLDESGKPAPAIIWAAVVNESVITKADEKTARQLPTHFLLNGEVRKGDDLEHADFLLTDHPKAEVTLDLLLGTQGWRRFAEQAPAEFRKTAPAEDADKMMLASATSGPIPTGWRTNVRKVFEEYWPKYEASLFELETAEQEKFRLESSGNLETDLAKATSLHTEKLNEFGLAADNLATFDAPSSTRSQWLPVYLIGLLGLAGLFYVVRSVAFKPGEAGRKPLAVGAIGMAALALFVGASVLFTSRDNAEWRALAQLAPKPDHREFGMKSASRAGVAIQEAVPGEPNFENIKKFDEAIVERRNFAAEGIDDQAKNQREFAVPGFVPPMAAAPMAGPGGRPPAMPQAVKQGLGGARPQAPMKPGMPMPGRGNALQLEREEKVNLHEAVEWPGMRRDQLRGGDFDRRFLGQQPQRGIMPGMFNAQFLQHRSEELNKAIADAKKDHPQFNEQPLRQAIAQNQPQNVPPLVVREYAHAASTKHEGATRTDFTETLLWVPALVTPKDGHSTVEFYLSDDVAPYQVMIAGHTLDGRLGAMKGTIEVRKPFSLDPKLPQEISSSDKLDVVMMGTNATDSAFTADVTVKPNGLTTLGGAETFKLDIAANNGNRKILRLVPEKSEGTVSLNLTGKAAGFEDSIERKLKVVQDGFPINSQKSDVLEERMTAELKLPEQIVPGSLKLKVSVYPNTLSEVQAGLEGMLREPNGCFEQTSTTNYPNVMILNYLNETNKASPELSTRAKQLIDRGYAKLTSFECQDPAKQQVRKGFEWFGGTAPPHEALTAYGLLQFTDMAQVAQVDEKMLQRTKEYLLSRRDGKGGFARNSRALDSFGGAPNEITNAYIVWALTEAERKTAEKSDLTKELEALEKLAGEGETAKDPYFLALVANALVNRGNNVEAIAILKTIAKLQQADGSVTGAKTSITRSMGKDLLVETTAIAVLGWLKVNETGTFRKEVELAAKWMGAQRGGYGAFGGTQSTILALKALIDYARTQKRPTENGTIRVFVGANEIAKTAFTTEQTGPIVLEIPNPEEVFKDGKGELRIETDAKQPYPCTVGWECRTRKPNSSTECPVELSTKLSNGKLAEGDTVRLAVQLKNLKKTDQGMVIAIVGIPAGLKLPEDMKQLKAFTEKPENGREKVSYWETRGRELILYWRAMGPEETIDLGIDLIADMPGEFRGPASRAYLYYGSEHKHWVAPVDVTVSAK